MLDVGGPCVLRGVGSECGLATRQPQLEGAYLREVAERLRAARVHALAADGERAHAVPDPQGVTGLRVGRRPARPRRPEPGGSGPDVGLRRTRPDASLSHCRWLPFWAARTVASRVFCIRSASAVSLRSNDLVSPPRSLIESLGPRSSRRGSPCAPRSRARTSGSEVPCRRGPESSGTALNEPWAWTSPKETLTAPTRRR